MYFDIHHDKALIGLEIMWRQIDTSQVLSLFCFVENYITWILGETYWANLSNFQNGMQPIKKMVSEITVAKTVLVEATKLKPH